MSELTFAEAMALDPSEVEALGTEDGWQRLSDDLGHWTLDYLRTARFRRARPRQSRVQEMAERFYADTPAGALLADYTGSAMKEAVRAVCAQLRKEGAYYSSDAVTAERLEREFLVPR